MEGITEGDPFYLSKMDFYSFYLYKGYSLYAESEDGLFHYDRVDKKWYPVEEGWDMSDTEGMKEISPERAARFL